MGKGNGRRGEKPARRVDGLVQGKGELLKDERGREGGGRKRRGRQKRENLGRIGELKK